MAKYILKAFFLTTFPSTQKKRPKIYAVTLVLPLKLMTDEANEKDEIGPYTSNIYFEEYSVSWSMTNRRGISGLLHHEPRRIALSPRNTCNSKARRDKPACLG